MADSECFRDMLAQHYDFMKKGTFIDVSFKVGQTKIGAHKTVLASASQVFRAMFEAEMKESQTQEVEIADVDGEAFKVFLDYIYSRKLENLDEHLDKLFMLADKYDIQPLVCSCEEFMKKSLTTDNAFDYLQLSDLYRRGDMKQSTIDFIKQNFESVIHSEKWAELKRDNPTLASTVLQSLIKDRSPSRKIKSYDEIDRRFCDAVIKIGEEEFPVHKFIFALKGVGLSTLFNEDPKQCVIEGVSVTDFKVIMDYVYLNKIPNDDIVDIGILKAAHKFSLQGLIDHCVSELKRRMKVENVIPTVIHADILELVSLKSSAMEFILNNLEEVKNNEHWGDLSKYPDLLMEIYISTK